MTATPARCPTRDRPPATPPQRDELGGTRPEARSDHLRAALEHPRQPPPTPADGPRRHAGGRRPAARADPGGDPPARIAPRDQAARAGAGAPPRSAVDRRGGRAAAPTPRAQSRPPRPAARTLRRCRLPTIVRAWTACPCPALPASFGERQGRLGPHDPRCPNRPECNRARGWADPSRPPPDSCCPGRGDDAHVRQPLLPAVRIALPGRLVGREGREARIPTGLALRRYHGLKTISTRIASTTSSEA